VSTASPVEQISAMPASKSVQRTNSTVTFALPGSLTGWSAFLLAAGGTAGTILTALHVGGLANPTNEILQGVSGVLLWITAHHVTKKAVS